MRRIAVLDAPSNLGLRPPTPTSVPGCAKAPGALRDHGLLTRLAARDAGCLTPPRYDPGDWRPGDGVAHAAEIAAYSRALADRIGAIIDGGEFPVVLGGDCSILIGSGLAMHRLGEAVGGRIGLVFVDGHSDFRHPGNASYVGAAAGEDLALVTGRGQANLAAIESRRPYFRDVDVVVLGIRAQDEYRLDLQAAGIITRPVPILRAEGAARSAQWARDQLVDCAGYWVHVDVDVLDPAVMPAVDAPDPGGIAFPELELLLTGLVDSPHCLGVEITVFDPDYDPDGRYAEEITAAVVSGLAPVRTVTPRPDLIAARRDLANQPDRAAAVAAVARPAVSVPNGFAASRAPIPVVPPAAVAVPVAPVVDAEPPVADPVAAVADPALPDAVVADGGVDPEFVAGSDADPVDPVDPADAAVGDADAAGEAGLDAADEAAVELAEDELTGELDAEASAALEEEDFPELTEDDSPEPADDDSPGDDEPADEEPQDEGLQDEGPGEFALDSSVEPDAEPGEPGDPEPAEDGEPVGATPVRPEVRLLSRPLGSAPLLDSEPLPATRPGMLRPRPPADPPAAGAFTLHTPRFGKFPPGVA
ncbi:hypothetical protein L3i22_097390 [Actinoplanes sp. L3-i22]|nr:arginase family protein [Actinoplanes sp. L3-i22]BCY14651.1 hypothetical protein L3i22_097390 [Actinoplanes sp. L3-i22]